MHDETVVTIHIVWKCGHNNKYITYYIQENEKDVRHVMSYN